MNGIMAILQRLLGWRTNLQLQYASSFAIRYTKDASSTSSDPFGSPNMTPSRARTPPRVAPAKAPVPPPAARTGIMGNIADFFSGRPAAAAATAPPVAASNVSGKKEAAVGTSSPAKSSAAKKKLHLLAAPKAIDYTTPNDHYGHRSYAGHQPHAPSYHFEHADSCDITININLGEVFTGGEFLLAARQYAKDALPVCYIIIIMQPRCAVYHY